MWNQEEIESTMIVLKQKIATSYVYPNCILWVGLTTQKVMSATNEIKSRIQRCSYVEKSTMTETRIKLKLCQVFNRASSNLR